jgi:multidrug resistance efflux pump
MRDCYGLKELYSFINVPFAQLRLAALQAQIARAEADIEQALHETELITRHQDYDRYSHFGVT